MFGGILVIGVIVCIVINVKNGGWIFIVGIIYVIVLLLIMMLFVFFVKLILMVCFVGIFIVVFYYMSEWCYFVFLLKGN